MKEGWEYKTLGEVGSFKRGGNFSKKDFVKDGFPCIHYGQIHTKFGIFTEKHLSCVPANIVKKERCAKKGDLVIAITSEDEEGSCKCTAWMADYEAYVGGHTAIYSHTLNPLFMSYYFKSPIFQIEKLNYTHGFKVVEISPKDIAKIKIPIPSLEEQRRIVSYLDSSFKLIDEIKNKALKSLTEAKALFQSALAEAMEPKEGTLMERIGDVFTTYAGGTPLKSQKDYYEGGEIPWLRSGEVCKKYISETELYITQKGMDNSSAKFYPENTVVVAMYGATAAQVGILKIKATSNQAVCGIIPHKDFIPEYVYYWFLFVQDDLASQAQGGAQPNISQIKIKNVLIPIINKEEQKRIVSRLDKLSSKVRAIEEKYQKMVEECDALKQAMLRDVFE